MINTINLIDVMDGLAGGIAATAALSLFLRSVWFGQMTIAPLPLALAGACLGYLPRNWHPARLFMGTSGSMFLGYALGTLAIVGGVKVGTAVIVLGLPMLDVAWVILRRLARGRSPLEGGDGEHLPQRLAHSGSPSPASSYCCTASAGCSPGWAWRCTVPCPRRQAGRAARHGAGRRGAAPRRHLARPARRPRRRVVSLSLAPCPRSSAIPQPPPSKAAKGP